MVIVVAFLEKYKLVSEGRTHIVLEHFLKFFGWEFNERAYTVDLDSREVFGVKDDTVGRCHANLEVKDPLNGGKIMTKNCYRWPDIQKLFQKCYH